ncbi:hypothetical protein [uncultured Holdemanella sp.]|uniref:hypothetical protein n=1 Tax=uncultured Holdemanella sp. TaxID=1763549 RepID=UPI0025EE3152|nr:hypothetical protein [uncultured Holdemanella sp.]
MKLRVWQRLLIGTGVVTFIASAAFSGINDYAGATVLPPTVIKLRTPYPQLQTLPTAKGIVDHTPIETALILTTIAAPPEEKVSISEKAIIKDKTDDTEDKTAIAKKEQQPIKKRNNIHSARYTGKSVEHRIKVWSWKGGKPIKTSLLSSTIYNVMERMSICPTSKEIHDIVLETAAVESLRGQLVKQKYGPALGIYQMEPETREDLLNWLKYRHKDVYNEVMVFWEKKQTAEWNYIHNIPWQTAMCLIKYWYVSGHNLQDLCRDRSSRAALWRMRYNTLKGKGSVHAYIENAKMYADASR